MTHYRLLTDAGFTLFIPRAVGASSRHHLPRPIAWDVVTVVRDDRTYGRIDKMYRALKYSTGSPQASGPASSHILHQLKNTIKQKSKPCDCNGASAELFSVRTGIQKSFLPWSDQFSNTSSPQYEAAVLSISQELTSALLTNGANKRLSNLAALSRGTMASVQVAQLRKGCNDSVVCFAYGVVYQSGAVASLPSLSDIQGQLDNDINVVDEAFVDDVSNPDANPCLYYEPTSNSPTSKGTTPKNRLPTSELSSSSTFSTVRPEDSSTQVSTTSHAATSPGITSTAKGQDPTTSQHSTSPSSHATSSPGPVPTARSASTLASSAVTSTYLPTVAGTTTASSISTEPSPSSFTSNFQTTRTSSTSSPIPPTTAAISSVSTLPSTPSTPNSQTATRTVAQSSASSTITASSMSTPSPTASATSSQTTTKSVPSSPTPVNIITASSIPTQSSSISSITISGTISTPGASSSSFPKPTESKSSTSTTRRSSAATTPTAYISASTTAAFNTVPHTSVWPSSTSLPDQGSSASLPSRTLTQQAPTSSTAPSESTSAQLFSSSSPPPSQSPTSTSRWTTTASCTGDQKYSGDIAVAFELTTNTDTAAVEALVTTLLTYSNNSFSFSPDAVTGVAPSSYILAPYPNTDFYRPTNKYGVLRASDINATLSTFNTFLSFQPESNAVIDDAFDFILGVANHSNTRIVVLVGVSDAFVQAAETSCKKLTDIGYSIFTVSLGTADFSPLATNKSDVYQQGDPTSSVEATKIANEIGAALLSESSICFHSSLPTTAVAMTSLLSTGRTVTTSRTPSCVDTFIQQDIAFVVELSTSSGSLDASRAASNFVTQNLMQQAVFNDIHSNFAIVPFPNASLYTIGGGIQDFGSLQIADFPFAFQMMFSYYPFLNGVDSDIQSGLQYTKDFEFPRLQDNYPRTILLFANSAAGVQAATSIASELKSDGVTILAISVSDSDDVNLRSLGTSPTDSWNLPVTDTSSYPTTAKSIALFLLKFGSVCQSP